MTDGASVMYGRFNSVSMLVQRYARHNVYRHWCLAHRLDLCGKNSIQKTPNVRIVRHVIHKNYIFWNSKGGKRKSILEEIAEELGLYLYTFGDTYEIRWVSADKIASSRIAYNYPILIATLSK